MDRQDHRGIVRAGRTLPEPAKHEGCPVGSVEAERLPIGLPPFIEGRRRDQASPSMEGWRPGRLGGSFLAAPGPRRVPCSQAAAICRWGSQAYSPLGLLRPSAFRRCHCGRTGDVWQLQFCRCPTANGAKPSYHNQLVEIRSRKKAVRRQIAAFHVPRNQ